MTTITVKFDDLRLAMESVLRVNNLGLAGHKDHSEVRYVELSILEVDGLPTELDISILDGTGGVSELEILEEVKNVDYMYKFNE